MVGGNKKDDSVVLNSSNVFAALGSLRKKKKSSSSDKPKQGSSKSNYEPINAEKEVFWAPAPLTVKSWADVDDEDDDDYYATTALSVSAWGAPAGTNHENHATEASESEEEGLDEVDDDVEEEHEHEDEPEASVIKEPIIKKPSEVSSAIKEPERQLSKKELKKKELEELDAVLAELGLGNNKQDTGIRDDSHGSVEGEKTENGLEAKKENIGGESKSSKKKKKKEKLVKDDTEPVDQPQGADVVEPTETENANDASAVDVKACLKKVATAKKKKSSKELDAAARAAAVEASARSAKLAAAKKKEKSHYNQQPVR